MRWQQATILGMLCIKQWSADIPLPESMDSLHLTFILDNTGIARLQGAGGSVPGADFYTVVMIHKKTQSSEYGMGCGAIYKLLFFKCIYGGVISVKRSYTAVTVMY